MKIRSAFYFIVSFLLLCNIALGQNKDEETARQYLSSGDFEKASLLYEKLYDKEPIQYYEPYLQSLIGAKNFSKAEKVTKKQIKLNEKSLFSGVYYVDQGYVFKLEGKKDKANNSFDKAIQQLPYDQTGITTVANAFISRDELDYAIESYQKGRRLLRGEYSFNIELAELFNRRQDIGRMMEQYLDLLLQNESYLNNVQALLQTNLSNDPGGEKNNLVRQVILKRIQDYPDRMVFSELLIWLFMQQKDFEGAFIQERALDKRNREDGGRMLYLAGICLDNKSFEVAEKCYDYVISKGKQCINYPAARMGKVDAKSRQILSSASRTPKDLENLETEYKETIKELDNPALTTQLLKSLAHLQAFYLDKAAEAEENVRALVNTPNISPNKKGEYKLELGDILLLEGKIWDATLLYSQVDLDFKNTPLGEEAKFKNARLSYFNGDFGWAQGQLDVLKSGTSHLIANDAMELSLLITENIDPVDSNETPLLMYGRSELLCYQNKFDPALKVLDSIIKMFPAHALMDEAYFKKGEIYRKSNRFNEAAEMYKVVMDNYGDDILGDDAVFNLAVLQDEIFKDTAKAMELYKVILEKYPSSLYVSDARKRYRQLRGEKLEN